MPRDLTPEDEAQFNDLHAGILAIPYCPQAPTPRQARFLLDFSREALYGGAAGGGKSSALLMAALMYIEVPHYSAIIFRKTYADLALPGALMDRAQEWLAGKAKYSDEVKTWTFPSGATLTFGYLEHANDHYRYQGSEFAFIGMDEVTQLSEQSYRYLFSRLRKVNVGPLADVPLRMRAATNPGGAGHGWVHRRFILPWEKWQEGVAYKKEHGVAKKGAWGKPDRNFHPATLNDNPHLNREEYAASLMELDAVTRAQLLRGDWSVRPEGRMFKREWFDKILPERPLAATGMMIRRWDLAATDPKPGTDPDWSVGVLLHRDSLTGLYTICDIVRLRASSEGVAAAVRSTAASDGHGVQVWMAQDPGAAGKSVISYYRRMVLDGYDFHAELETGSKIVRAGPTASLAEAGNIRLVAAPWVGPFLDEVEIFPDGEHDDQVDALSGAHAVLARRSGAVQIVSPQGVGFRASPWKEAG